MTKTQILNLLRQNENNRILSTPNHSRQTVQYVVQCFFENACTGYVPVNPRTVRSLMKQDILKRIDGGNTIGLNRGSDEYMMQIAEAALKKALGPSMSQT